MKFQAFGQLIRQRVKLAGVLSGTLIHSGLALSAQLFLPPSPGAIVVGIVVHTNKCQREHPTMAKELDAGMRGWISRHSEMYNAVAKSGDLARGIKDAEKTYIEGKVYFSRSDCEHILMGMNRS